MKISKYKFIMCGVLLGVMLSISVTSFALMVSGTKIEAWLQDNQVSIIVDGKYVTLPSDMHIINYQDRIYTPARLIGEQLGAEVFWEDARQAIIINPPEPIYIEVESEPEELNKEEQTQGPKFFYSPLPMRRVADDISINLVKMEHYNSESHLILDFINRSQFPIMFLKEKTYFEYNGEKHVVVDDFIVGGDGVNDLQFTNLQLFVNTTNAFHEETDVRFKFPRIPDGVTGVKLNIAIEVYDTPFSQHENTILNFEFYIDPSQEEYYDWQI